MESERLSERYLHKHKDTHLRDLQMFRVYSSSFAETNKNNILFHFDIALLSKHSISYTLYIYSYPLSIFSSITYKYQWQDRNLHKHDPVLTNLITTCLQKKFSSDLKTF